MWLPVPDFDCWRWRDWQRQWLKWKLNTEQKTKLSSCTKKALSASWAHGLIKQSVIVSEQNSVVMASNPTQANFLKMFWWWIPYVWLHSPMLMWSPMQDFDRGKCGNSRRNSQNEIWIMNKRWNCSNCAKLALSASWTHGLTAQVVRASEQNSVVLGWNPFQGNFW